VQSAVAIQPVPPSIGQISVAEVGEIIIIAAAVDIKARGRRDALCMVVMVVMDVMGVMELSSTVSC